MGVLSNRPLCPRLYLRLVQRVVRPPRRASKRHRCAMSQTVKAEIQIGSTESDPSISVEVIENGP